MLGVSRSWLYQAAVDGRIPHVRLGSDAGPIRFVATDIDQWLEDARRRWRPAAGDPTSTARTPTPAEGALMCVPWRSS